MNLPLVSDWYKSSEKFGISNAGLQVGKWIFHTRKIATFFSNTSIHTIQDTSATQGRRLILKC